MKYFDFDGLEHKEQVLDVFLLVAAVYLIIFSVSWVIAKFPK